MLVETAFAFLFALLATFLAIFALGRRGPWDNPLVFFGILFLATLATGLWIGPFGPTFFGVAWLPFLVGSLFFVLLILSVPFRTQGVAGEPASRVATKHTLNLFFWMLVLALLVAVGAGFMIDTGYAA